MWEEPGTDQAQWPIQGCSLLCPEEQFGLDEKASIEARLQGLPKDTPDWAVGLEAAAILREEAP